MAIKHISVFTLIRPFQSLHIFPTLPCFWSNKGTFLLKGYTILSFIIYLSGSVHGSHMCFGFYVCRIVTSTVFSFYIRRIFIFFFFFLSWCGYVKKNNAIIVLYCIYISAFFNYVSKLEKKFNSTLFYISLYFFCCWCEQIKRTFAIFKQYIITIVQS